MSGTSPIRVPAQQLLDEQILWVGVIATGMAVLGAPAGVQVVWLLALLGGVFAVVMSGAGLGGRRRPGGEGGGDEGGGNGGNGGGGTGRPRGPSPSTPGGAKPNP